MTMATTYHLNQDYDLLNRMCKVSQWKHSQVLRSRTPAEVMLGWNWVSTGSGMIQTDAVKADIETKSCWYNCLVNTAVRPLVASCYQSDISQYEILALQTHHSTVITSNCNELRAPVITNAIKTKQISWRFWDILSTKHLLRMIAELLYF